MRAWLDQYTEMFGESVRQFCARERCVPGLAALSNYQIMRELTTDGAMASIEAANRGAKEECNAEFLGALRPFFLRPDELRVEPYACALGRDLAQSFRDATVSPNVLRHADAFAKERFVTYVDCADRACRLGDKYHLKAIIIYRVPRADRFVGERAADPYVPDETDRLRFFAVVGPIGEIAQARMAWHAGARRFDCDDEITDLLLDLFKQTGKAIDDIATDIENIVWLTLAYAAAADPGCREPVSLADDHLRARLDRAARRQLRRFTLFRIERLRPPPDNFGRHGDGGHGDGWHLERRIAVRGHFKMQPCGPRGDSRKLIFVDQHFRGPLEGAPLHPITILKP